MATVRGMWEERRSEVQVVCVERHQTHATLTKPPVGWTSFWEKVTRLLAPLEDEGISCLSRTDLRICCCRRRKEKEKKNPHKQRLSSAPLWPPEKKERRTEEEPSRRCLAVYSDKIVRSQFIWRPDVEICSRKARVKCWWIIRQRKTTCPGTIITPTR